LEGRYPRFVSFLNTLCGWMDSPVPLNQNILVQELLQDSDLVLVKGALVERVDQKGSDWQISWVHRVSARCGSLCCCRSEYLIPLCVATTGSARVGFNHEYCFRHLSTIP
jgi:hypothetical protein